jgi:hypothetical protein
MDVETEKLRIRDVSVADLDAFVDLWSDSDVERWMTGYGPRSRAEVMEWLATTIS